jgi:ATP-binding protein involved in chromosome partitioning
MISMAVLAPPDKPMILRGPMLHGIVRQFLTDVNWGELDYLIVDMPPGTGDVQLVAGAACSRAGRGSGDDAAAGFFGRRARALKMFEQVAVPVFGVVENMSYFIPPPICPKNATTFSAKAAGRICRHYGVSVS